ncbi:MAG TPA: zinc-binding alcohol dehydrogenase family protein [Planctomycetota bacterium]|nr:zinc-binding alcohol dehydrogenase family protein [Planctomycetota bacterium]
MKAIQLEKPQSFRQIDIAEPKAPGPGEVLLKVHKVAVCGSDIGGFLGKMPFFSYPRIPGHELGVSVLAVGAGVTNVKVGDRCSVQPYINCGKCYSCRRGFTNCCEHNQTLGVMCDGGLTERIILPASKLHVSAKLTFDQLALVETLAIGCHAVDRGEPKASESVLVIGAGPIGLSAMVFAKLSGAKTIVMDVNEQRLKFVRERMGITDTILVGDGNEQARLATLIDGNLADVVIDATGNNKSMTQALNYCAFKGRLVYVGIAHADLVILHAPALHRRELDIRASRNALPKDFDRIIKLIEDGKIDTTPWITHQVPFANVVADFASLAKPETGVIKAVISID